jgi:hypothetical protein
MLSTMLRPGFPFPFYRVSANVLLSNQPGARHWDYGASAVAGLRLQRHDVQIVKQD